MKEDCPYITNGLVFWLDLIGGKQFDLTDCTFSETGVVFSALGSRGSYAGPIGTGALNDTIEVAVTGGGQYGGLSTSQMVLSPDNSNGGDYIALGRGGGINGAWRMNGTSNPRVNLNGYTTISINSEYAVEGRHTTSHSNNDTWNANTTGYTYLGKRNSGNTYPFNGTMHCIRIYNRHLSVAEMIANQTIDVQRFGLT